MTGEVPCVRGLLWGPRWVIILEMAVVQILEKAASFAGGAAGAVRDVVEQARARHKSLVDALLDSKLIDERRFFAALGRELDMPFREGSDIELPESIHNKFPAKLALRHRVLPSRVNGKEITLLTYDPFNLEALQEIGKSVSKKVCWELSTKHYIVDALRRSYGVGAANFEDIIEGREVGEVADALAQEVNILEEEDEATIMSFVNQVFREALHQRATDVHVEPLENDLRIRYRVDGALQEVSVPPNMRVLQASLISRLKIMAQLDIAERRLPQDGRINLELDGERIDVRVATIPSVNGESVSLRMLTRQRFDFEALGLDEDTANVIREMLAQPNGIFLVTGPTGSGKSTTLYTFLRMLNTEERRIVTIEDPVENKLDGIVQIAVKPEINLTFASGLRSILRGDPNVIMVGEMRDTETAEIAIRGALTGHLVFSTLHTNDAVGGVNRLLDMDIEPFLVATSVRCFLAQRLVRMLCEDCKRPANDLQGQYLDDIGFPKNGRESIMKAVGCQECRGTGYRGRLAIVEVCKMTPEMQELVTSRAPASSMRELALKQGMVPLRSYGWKKVVEGFTSIEEIVAVASDLK